MDPVSQAFAVDFSMFLVAKDQREAVERVRAWRALAVALGHQPGHGRVRPLSPGELSKLPELQRDLERARLAEVASAESREQAIEALATHMDGELSGARALVESIEHEMGFLPAQVAAHLARARRRNNNERSGE